VARARREFAHVSGFDARTLDIELAPSTQGIGVGSYDLVVANNVIHATADIRQSILHCMDMLAPHGRLILVEGTLDSPWLDITFGLTDGWWRFDDDLARVQSPLISAGAWRTLFAELRLRADILELPGDGSGILSRQVVCIVERLPSTPQPASRALLAGGARAVARAEAAAQPAETRSTPLHPLLRSAWAQAFALPEVNDDADFFELGGDSLTAVQIGSVLKRELGADLDLFSMLLDHPTLGAFASALQLLLVQEAQVRPPADLDVIAES